MWHLIVVGILLTPGLHEYHPPKDVASFKTKEQCIQALRLLEIHHFKGFCAQES